MLDRKSAPCFCPFIPARTRSRTHTLPHLPQQPRPTAGAYWSAFRHGDGVARTWHFATVSTTGGTCVHARLVNWVLERDWFATLSYKTGGEGARNRSVITLSVVAVTPPWARFKGSVTPLTCNSGCSISDRSVSVYRIFEPWFVIFFNIKYLINFPKTDHSTKHK